MPRRAYSIVLLLALLVTLCGCNSNETDSTSSMDGGKPSPTVTPRPTPNTPQIIALATLGGTPAAFTALYPEAKDDYGTSFNSPDLYIYTANMEGYTLWISVSVTKGTDGTDHASELDVEPAPSTTPDTWTDALGSSLITRFLPPRAGTEHTITYLGTLRHVYTSPDIADTFTASAFQAEDKVMGYTVAPGTFEWNCDEQPGKVSRCQMKIGAPVDGDIAGG